jgi:hypothetical protein
MRSPLAALLVSLTALSLAAQAPPRWNLVPELRIGGDATTGPEYEFTTIREIAIGPGGSIYVVQGQEQEIRVYDAQGKYVRTIGRQGGGPGEFTGLRTIGFMGDTLYTTDTRLMRITLFRADGSLITTIAAEAAASAPRRDAAPFRPIPSALLPDGSVLAGSSFPSHLVSNGQITARPVFRVTRSVAVLDTIAWVPVGSGQGTMQSGDATLFFVQPISDDPITVMSGPSARVFVVERAARPGSTAFPVTAISAGGDTLWSRLYPYRPARLPAGVADSIVDVLVRRFANPNQSARFSRDQIRKAAFIPDHQVTVTRAFAAADGSLWLRREEFGEVLNWTVLTPDGQIAATLSLPRNVRPMTVIGDKAWGVELDDVDVPLLVRYRIRR